MKARRKLIAAIVTLVLIAGIIPAEYLFAQLDRQTSEIKRQWPTVPGVIRSLEVKQTRSDIISDFFLGERHDLLVRYEYAVKGATYRNSLGWEANSPDENHGYFAGKEVNVHYDPAQPGDSYIELRPSGWVAPLILTPIIVAGVCILVWLWALRKLRMPRLLDNLFNG